MSAILQQNQNQDNQIDSSGISYLHQDINPALAKHFLKIEYINHAQKSANSVQSSSTTKENVRVDKSFGLSLEYSDYVLILLIGLFALLAYIRLTGKNYFSRLLMSVRNYTYSVSFYREKNLAFVLYKNLLLFVFYISAGLLASVVIEYFKLPLFHKDRLFQFLILTILLLVLIYINRFFVRISGFIFGKNRIASEYLFFYGNLLRLIGIPLLILNVGLFFINKEAEFVFIYIAIFIGFVTYLVKVIRILIIFFNNRFSLYYLILYFCALEIIPVVLLIKLFLFYKTNGIHSL